MYPILTTHSIGILNIWFNDPLLPRFFCSPVPANFRKMSMGLFFVVLFYLMTANDSFVLLWQVFDNVPLTKPRFAKNNSGIDVVTFVLGCSVPIGLGRFLWRQFPSNVFWFGNAKTTNSDQFLTLMPNLQSIRFSITSIFWVFVKTNICVTSHSGQCVLVSIIVDNSAIWRPCNSNRVSSN